jgi:hypothetical protein
MFVAPKAGFSSHSFHTPKFQGFHFHPALNSAYVGQIPDYYGQTYYPVYVTDDRTDGDEHLPDGEKPGFDKFRFERSKAAHKAAMKAVSGTKDEEEIEKRFEAYKQRLMSYAAANWESIVARHQQPETSEYVPGYSSKKSNKKILIAAFVAFLMLTNAFLKPER